jgi:hypothetical protein
MWSKFCLSISLDVVFYEFGIKGVVFISLIMYSLLHSYQHFRPSVPSPPPEASLGPTHSRYSSGPSERMASDSGYRAESFRQPVSTGQAHDNSWPFFCQRKFWHLRLAHTIFCLFFIWENQAAILSLFRLLDAFYATLGGHNAEFAQILHPQFFPYHPLENCCLFWVRLKAHFLINDLLSFPHPLSYVIAPPPF